MLKNITLCFLILSFWSCQGTSNHKSEKVVTTRYPKRIISVAPLITEVIFALGAQDRLVGRTDYCLYPIGTNKIASIGGVTNPSIETIVSLNPDLVITSTHFRQEISQQLNKLGVSVTSVFNQTDLAGSFKTIEQIGNLLGLSKRADSLIENLKQKMDSLLYTIPPKNNRPTVYYVVGFGKNGDYTGGSDTFIHHLIEASGGRNIASDIKGWSYNLEMLLANDPDIILIRNGWKEAFCNHPGYSKLSAIKNEMVFEVDKNIFEINGPRIIEALDTLIHIINKKSGDF